MCECPLKCAMVLRGPRAPFLYLLTLVASIPFTLYNSKHRLFKSMSHQGFLSISWPAPSSLISASLCGGRNVSVASAGVNPDMVTHRLAQKEQSCRCLK